MGLTSALDHADLQNSIDQGGHAPAPKMSVLGRLLCRSRVWTFGSGLVAYAIPVDTLGVEVLEIGAGSGAVARQLASVNPVLMLTVTDVDPRMVRAAPRRLRPSVNSSVIRAYTTSLPFGSASFDSVVSCFMVHHVFHRQQALSEFARALRPGGRLVGLDLSHTRVNRLLHKAERSSYRLIRVSEVSAACAEQKLSVSVTTRLAGQIMSFSTVTVAGLSPFARLFDFRNAELCVRGGNEECE